MFDHRVCWQLLQYFRYKFILNIEFSNIRIAYFQKFVNSREISAEYDKVVQKA